MPGKLQVVASWLDFELARHHRSGVKMISRPLVIKPLPVRTSSDLLDAVVALLVGPPDGDVDSIENTRPSRLGTVEDNQICWLTPSIHKSVIKPLHPLVRLLRDRTIRAFGHDVVPHWGVQRQR